MTARNRLRRNIVLALDGHRRPDAPASPWIRSAPRGCGHPEVRPRGRMATGAVPERSEVTR